MKLFFNSFKIKSYLKIMNESLKKLFKDYDDNLLNYFCGLSPIESKKFNKTLKKVKENKNKWKKIQMV